MTKTSTQNSASTLKGATQGRSDLFRMLPDQLVVVTDKAHPLYDERVALPLDEGLIKSLMEHGILQPVIVRRNGPLFEVQDGRQRVRAAVEANKRLKSAHQDRQILVPIMVRKDDDLGAAKVMVAANEIRSQDSPIVRARKAQRLIDMGLAKEGVANQFGISVAALSGLLRVLDTTSDVQKMVDQGMVPVTAASKLAALPREEQKKAMEDLRAAGLAITGKSVKQKVKNKQEAARTGQAERAVVLAPKRSVVANVADAYAEADDTTGQIISRVLAWVNTGMGADEIVGPGGAGKLSNFLRELEREGKRPRADKAARAAQGEDAGDPEAP